MYMTRRITQVLLSMIVLASLALAPQGDVRAIAVTRYVSPTGTDSADCSNSAAPCLTIQYAINHAAADDTIEVAVGTYTAVSGPQVVLIDRNLILSGGWDAGFVAQGGRSTIDGGKKRRGLDIWYGVTATVDHFVVQKGSAPLSGGGGIRSWGTLTLAYSRVIENVGLDGGGIESASGPLTINDSTISNNTGGYVNMGGGGGAGGIYIFSGSAAINNTTISGNTIVGGFNGSAISTFGTVSLNNSTVSGNIATYGTAAIYAVSAPVALNNSTVTGNTAQNGSTGGIHGPASMKNSIVAGNTGWNGSKSDCSGKISSVGYNLLGTNSGCTFTASTGDLVGTETLPIDARLLPLGNYGGPNLTHALTFSSPALDAGNPAAPGGGGNACLAADQRGVTRPQGARCDIGAYEAGLPLVKSISRASPNPTSASTVKFSVIFTDAVTGVNTVAPFSDFKLSTAGITGAAVSAVSGSGSTYTVSVKTGSGNGTIKLNLIDDGTIHDGEGNQLGGSGPGNGNFPIGQAYTIKKIPSLLSPKGTWWDRTPSYTWRKTPTTTQYQYQLAKGTTTIYTKQLLSSACGIVCPGTPSTILNPADYKWRARALASGMWQTWSPYLSFKLVAPKAGFWKAAYDEFYVTPDRSRVDDFASYINVTNCGSYKITHTPLVWINNGHFSFSTDGYYASGAFDSTYPNSASAQGKVSFSSFYISGCGYVTGGPFAWSALWKNSNQPADAASMSIGPIVVESAPEGERTLPLPAPQEP